MRRRDDAIPEATVPYTLDDIRLVFETFAGVRSSVQHIDHALAAVNRAMARRNKAPVTLGQLAKWSKFHDVLFKDCWRRKAPGTAVPTPDQLMPESRP